MNETRTEQLTRVARAVFLKHADAIHNLPVRGPSGGKNALYIKGWSQSPNCTITRAVNLAGGSVLPYWTGTGPTPASAIPTVVLPALQKASHHIFGDD